ncbi:hypothetical protein [Enterococcus faecalis]|nr:hypothetical protein [Enterococcus faecalis]MCA6712088.1 hypothetical protein [Enterococcus faecalis]MCA6731150.1 hypothetical protein [Enterococcus faecalis]
MEFLAKKMRLFEKGVTYEAYVRDILVVFLVWLMVWIDVNKVDIKREDT